jgi:hypothetical protein
MHGSVRQSTGHRRWGRYILCSSLRASSSFYRPAFVSAFSLDGKLIAWCVGAPRCRWIGRAPPFGAANPSRHLRSSVSPPSGRTARHMRTASATLHQDGNTVTRCAFPGSAREHTARRTSVARRRRALGRRRRSRTRISSPCQSTACVTDSQCACLRSLTMWLLLRWV